MIAADVRHHYRRLIQDVAMMLGGYHRIDEYLGIPPESTKNAMDRNQFKMLRRIAVIDGWAGVATRLGYYNYMYNLADGTLPFFKVSACRKEFPYLAEKGLSYMTIEVLSNWHIYAPQIYLSLRLAYDPYADAAAIMEDYWQKFYGRKAAPHMQAYWMGLDAAQQRLTTHAGSFFGLAQMYTPEFLSQCEDRLAKAAAAAQGHRARVSLDPRRGDVVVAFERSAGVHATELSRAIPHRQCTRQPYEAGSLEADELRQLEQVGRGGRARRPAHGGPGRRHP